MKNILLNGYFNKNLGDDLFFKELGDRYKKYNFYMIVSRKKVK